MNGLLSLRPRIVVPVLAALSLVALGLAGCSSPSVVGKWKVDTSSIPQDTSANGAFAKSLADSMAKAISLNLKDDKTFEMSMLLPFTGTYTVDGHSLKLHVTSMMGMDTSKMGGSSGSSSSQDMTGTISDDGSKITITSSGAAGSGKPMVFVRDK